MCIKKNYFICLFAFAFISFDAFAQDLKIDVGNNKELDSLRKIEALGKDSIVYTAKYIKYTKLSLSKDSVVLLPLDTTLINLQHYSPLMQPKSPTINTGVMGLAAKPLLYEPTKSIGFVEGYNSLNYYEVRPDDIMFYEARTPYTSLYFVNAGKKEQLFKATHTQNVKSNLNAGVNFNRADSRGSYARQRGDNLNVALFTWYKSPNKRYNLWATAIFNNLRAFENGSVLNDSIFSPDMNKISREAEAVRFRSAKNIYKKNTLFFKQTYYIGRVDTSSSSAIPTNKITHIFESNSNRYGFSKNEYDAYGVMPAALRKSDGRIDSIATNDSTHVSHYKNEFMYSFFLRSKKSTVIKNEVKLDVGIRHDYYKLQTLGLRTDGTRYEDRISNFQNISLLGNAGYRFSNKIDLNVDVQQIMQGRNAGDFLYEAKSFISFSESVGGLQLGGYIQNKSPEEIFNYYNGNHYEWINSFKRTKVANLSAEYINRKFGLTLGAKYYLTTNHLYFQQSGENSVSPTQEESAIGLIKFDLSKKWVFGKFAVENYFAYQKNDRNDIFRTPEFYTYHSVYVNLPLVKVLKTSFGFDVRYNSSYLNYTYSPALGQFIVGGDEKFKTEPIVDFFFKANLKRANIFIKYDYLSQGLFSKGYYTVNRYPMQDALVKFGVTWNFYD